MNYTDIEFKEGDIVTFKPYETAIKAKVKGIKIGYPFGRTKDVSYELTGVSRPLISICTGNSIMESKYYHVKQN